jgi:hypothetical protein
MRRTAVIGLLLGAAMLVAVGGAHATGGDRGGGPSAVAAQYAPFGDVGLLTIQGAPGAHYDVFDATGLPAGQGRLDEPVVSVVVANAGPGPGGVLLWVVLDGEIVAVSDPEWDWN